MGNLVLVMEPHPCDSGIIPSLPVRRAVDIPLDATIKEMVVAQFPFPQKFTDFDLLVKEMNGPEARAFLELLSGCHLAEAPLWELAHQLANISYPFRGAVALAWLKSWNGRSLLSYFSSYPDGKGLFVEEIKGELKGNEAEQAFLEELLTTLLIRRSVGIKVQIPDSIGVSFVNRFLTVLWDKRYIAFSRIDDRLKIAEVTLCSVPEDIRPSRFKELYEELSPIKQLAVAKRVELASKRAFGNAFERDAYYLQCAVSSTVAETLLAEFSFSRIRSEMEAVFSRLSEEEMVELAELLFNQKHLELGEQPFLELAERLVEVPRPLREPFALCWYERFQPQSYLASLVSKQSFPDSREVFIQSSLREVKRRIGEWLETPLSEEDAAGIEKIAERIILSVLRHEGGAALQEFKELADNEHLGPMVQSVFRALKELEVVARLKFDEKEGYFTFFVGPVFQSMEEKNLVKVDEIVSSFDKLKDELFALLITRMKANTTIEGEYPDFSPNCLAAAEFCRDHEPVDILLLDFAYSKKEREEMCALLSRLPPDEMFEFVMALDQVKAERLSGEDYIKVASAALDKERPNLALEVPCYLFPVRTHLGSFRRVVEELPERERCSFAELFARKDLGLETLPSEDLLKLAEKIAKKPKEKRLRILKVSHFLSTFPYEEAKGTLSSLLKPLSMVERESFCSSLGKILPRLTEEEALELLNSTVKVPPPFREKFMMEWIKSKQRDSKKILSRLVMEKISSWIPFQIQLGRMENGTTVQTFVKSGKEVAERLIDLIVSEESAGTILLKQLGVPSLFQTSYTSKSLLALLEELKRVGLLNKVKFEEGVILFERNKTDRLRESESESDPQLLEDLEWAERLGLDEDDRICLETVSDHRSRLDILTQLVRTPREARATIFADLIYQNQCRSSLGAANLMEKIMRLEVSSEAKRRIAEMSRHSQFNAFADLILEALPIVETDAVDGMIRGILAAQTAEEAKELLKNLKDHDFWMNFNLEKQISLLRCIQFRKEVKEVRLVEIASLRCLEDIEPLITFLEGRGCTAGYTYDRQAGTYLFNPGPHFQDNNPSSAL